MRKIISSTVLGLAVLVGCTDEETPISPNAPATPEAEAALVSNQENVAPKDELVATPNGWYHKSCVYELPDGAKQDREGVVTLKDGPIFELPKCLFPGKRTADGYRIEPRRQGGTHRIPDPVNDGWMEYAYETVSGHTFSEITAEWVVPEDPDTSYPYGVGPYYTFPGLQSDDAILQPVLEYGRSSNQWTFASWRCSDTYGCSSSSHPSASPGDTILGQ